MLSMPGKVRIAAESSHALRGVDIWLLSDMPDGDVYKADPTMVFKRYEPGEIIEPTFHLKLAEAQMLLDDLYACGFRPSNEDTDTDRNEDVLAAVRAHNDDLRMILLTMLQAETDATPAT